MEILHAFTLSLGGQTLEVRIYDNSVVVAVEDAGQNLEISLNKAQASEFLCAAVKHI